MTTAQINAAREAVNTYRLHHEQLYKDGWYQGISNDHTPLLNILLLRLSILGFHSLDELFTTSQLFNIHELGFTSLEAFHAELHKNATYSTIIDQENNKIEVTELTPEAQILLNNLREMWH